MRTLAVSVAALLVLAVVSPAFAQPFADVPTDHWAFDAIAELAAKGIIEGFPDGTFKGDRGVTRYEVAMIVARILARIEAIKIPAPAAAAPAPQVTRADVQTIQRLVNEFRAELAALGVRVTAVEEELTALKTKTTNVSVSGDLRIRYNFQDGAFSTIRYRNRLTFTSQATPTVKATARAYFGAGAGTSSTNYTFGTPATFPAVTFDKAYLDISGVFGVNWRVGQQGYTLGAGVGWSGYGLLYDPTNACVGTFAPLCVVDGLLASGSWAGFSFELADWRESNTLGFDILTARVTTQFSGWTVGVDGLYQHRNSAVAMPTTATGAGASGSLTGAANTNDTGWQVDLTGDLFPGISLGAAYATFNPHASAGTSSNAYAAWAVLDLSTMGMSMMSPTLTLWYKDYGSATAGAGVPYQSGASTEIGDTQDLAWNFTGWGAALDMKIGSGWSGSFSYESGNQKVTPALAVQEYYASLAYALAPQTTVSFNYFKSSVGGVDSNNFYRVQLNYSF